MLRVQVFAGDSFLATDDSTPRRTISKMDYLRAEMKRAKEGFGRVDGFVRAQASAAAQAPKVREDVKNARTQAADAKAENLTRLRSATSPDTAVAAPAPAREDSPGVAVLRREIVAVKGQPNLLEAFETIIKAAEKQRKRAAHHGGSSAAGHLPHQVFGGPSGTGKSSSVEVLAKVLASPEVALLKKPSVVTLNKDTDLSKVKGDNQPQKIRAFFEKAKGGILFLDEVHRRPKEFAQALLTPLEDFKGKVMVIIAGYDESVRKWLRDSDPGLPSRFPGRVEFLKLSVDTLVEIGMAELAKGDYSLDPSARDTFRRVTEHVSARAEPCDLPLNARGVQYAVSDMILKHDVRDDLDDTDVCIRAEDILAACPFAASPPPAATASPHAPSPAGEGRDGSTSSVPAPAAAPASSEAAPSSDASRATHKSPLAPAAAAEAAAGGARRSSRPSPQASERAAVAGPSTADAPADASDSEEAPLSEQARTDTAPSKSAAPTPAASRKRKAESGDAQAETTIVLNAIDAHYVPKAGGTAIAVMDFLRQLLPDLTGTVKSDVEAAQRVAKGLRETLQKAIDIVNKERGVNTTMYQDENGKWPISGFARLPPRAAVR